MVVRMLPITGSEPTTQIFQRLASGAGRLAALLTWVPAYTFAGHELGRCADCVPQCFGASA